MTWLKHRSTQAPELPANHYDFAKMVKSARESDPGKFKQLQTLFKKQRRIIKPKDKK